MNNDKVAAVIGILILGLAFGVLAGAFTGWLLMLVLGNIFGLYGLAGPGFFVSWALAAVLSVIVNANVSTN